MLFFVLEPRWWNKRHLAVRTAESLVVFKRRIKAADVPCQIGPFGRKMSHNINTSLEVFNVICKGPVWLQVSIKAKLDA